MTNKERNEKYINDLPRSIEGYSYKHTFLKSFGTLISVFLEISKSLASIADSLEQNKEKENE